MGPLNLPPTYPNITPVSPSQTKALTCPRTVLLTGIPGVMEADCLQDMLEIFFQKGSNGGGEISNSLYNPPGQTAMALFQEDTGI